MDFVTHFFVRWPREDDSGFYFWRTFSCPLELHLFLLRRRLSRVGVAIMETA